MSTIYPTLSRLPAKESFDDDELTDIDDEVFIRDGKTGGGFKSQDEGVKRPLMAPRKKRRTSFDTQKLPLRALLLPMCYGIMALVILLGLIMLCVVTVNVFPVPFTIIKNLFPPKENPGVNLTNEILPCTSLSSSIVWVRTLPKLTSEAPLRSVDVDGDGIEDIIVGFSTGLDTLDAPEFLCNLYFKGQTPCLGGVKALDGRTGDTMWTHWTEHAIFSIDCAFDITDDKVKDCIITGRGGILHAVDGQDGAAIWEVSNKEFPASVMEPEIILNVYDARYMTDIDGDGTVDVIVSHTTQTGTLRSSEIIMLSGKTGTVIKTIDFSKNEQLFIAPQTLVHPDGEIMYLLAASTPEQSGGLYIISHSNLLYGKMNLRTLQYGKGKGVLLAPILVDITLDGTADIIVSSLDSRVRAYNGRTFELIWNYTVPESEIISIPIPGYYNDDNVPDIMVKHQVGPGFPVYYYSVSTILDGKTGKPLLEQPIKDSGNGQMSGLSLSVDGPGNDWFLYWSANCVDHSDVDEKYRFLKGQTLLSQSRANLCKLRFNTTLNRRLLAMSQHVGPPGQSLYFSEDWKSVELNNSVDARHETEEYLNNLPSQIEMNNAMENGPMTAPRVDKSKANTQERIEDERIINDFPSMESNLGVKIPNEMNYLVNNNNNNNNNNNERKEVESYPAYNDLAEYKTKVSNDFPGEVEWSNSNNNDWSNLPLEMRYDRNDPNSQESNRRRKRNSKFAESSKIKRNVNINNNNNGNKNYEGIDQSIQRQPPTGLFLPSLVKNPRTTSIDVVFSTYWLPPSEVSLVLLQQDLECIHLKEESARRKIEAYERENIIADCLANRGINYKLYREGLDRENVKFSLGQMTIYRMKLECVCPEDLLPGQACNNISRTQSWPAHLGRNGDGYFRPFLKPNT